MKQLTIIIPSYNMEAYLPKNLENLIKARNIEDIEILVVNDGSTDKTLEIARSYEGRCKSLKVIDKPNGHYGSCINAALKVATGKYFRILDADDWFETDALDCFVEKLKDCDADLVVTLRTEWTKMNDGSWEKIKYPILDVVYGRLYDATLFKFEEYSHSVEFNMHSMTYKTEVLRQSQLQLPHGICYTDMIYCMVPLTVIKTIILFDIYLYNYFVGREGNSTNSKTIKQNILHIVKVLAFMLNYIESHPTPFSAVLDNQLRFVKEALNLFLGSLEMHVTIPMDLYDSCIERIRLQLNRYAIDARPLHKYYFADWYKRGGYKRLMFWLKVNRILHPKFWLE